MEIRFDIYCNSHFSLSEPRFARASRVDPVVRLIGQQVAPNAAGYLELSLSQREALWLSKMLRQAGVDSYPVAENYKGALVSAELALLVAQEYVDEKRDQYPDRDYENVEEIQLSWWLSKIAYGFFSKSKKMERDGISPPGLSLCVDRVSGTIMSERELLEAELGLMLTDSSAS